MQSGKQYWIFFLKTRLGLPVYFIGEYGLDEVGNFIDLFLKENSVITDYVYRYYDGKSALALAFLNEYSDASYDFYKIYPQKRLNINFPEIQENDIVLFGSMYAITYEVRYKLMEFIKQANKRKAIVIYDPNFRKIQLHELQNLKPLIIDNIKHADILRGSNEDFSFIFGANNADETYESVIKLVPNLLYTASRKGVYLKTPHFSADFDVKLIEPKSTIGAGDSFNAGIVYSLYKQKIQYKDLENINKESWEQLVNTAVEFATHVCLNYDNYISKEFAKHYLLNDQPTPPQKPGNEVTSG